MDCMQSPPSVQLRRGLISARSGSEVMTVHDGTSSKHRVSSEHTATGIAKASRADTPAHVRRLDGLDNIYQKLKAEELTRLRSFDPSLINDDAEILIDNRGITDITQRPEELVVLRLLYLLTGSSHSLIAVQQTMQAACRSIDPKPQQPRAGSSSADYFQVIEALTTTEAYCAMLKRCYTVKMFANWLETLCPPDSAFEIETPQSLSERAERSAGNPKNKSRSAATDAVMKELYPGLAATEPQYEKKRRLIGELRRLATRLHMFTAKFGFGILALLPLYLYLPDKHTVDSR